MAEQFYGQSRETMGKWRASLKNVLPIVKHDDCLTNVLSCNLKRTYNVIQVEDFTWTHYVYNRKRAMDRIDRYLKAIHTRKAPVLAMQAHAEFLITPPGYIPQHLGPLVMPV